MKFRVTMKDPDCLHDAIKEAVEADVAALDLPLDEAAVVADVRSAKARSVCATWFRFDEYITVEIDTDAGTATVVPQ